jgi:hypothetical protein
MENKQDIASRGCGEAALTFEQNLAEKGNNVSRTSPMSDQNNHFSITPDPYFPWALFFILKEVFAELFSDSARLWR